MSDEIKGLTVIFTGDGKGKTSAALGIIFRALGHGFNCKIIQFIKGNLDSGEIRSAKKFGEQLELVRAGKGFTWDKSIPRKQHVEAAKDGLNIAKEALLSDKYTVILLDEILYAVRAELVTIEEIAELIKMKKERVHLILTGRGADQKLIDMADMVSEILPIKHPMKLGVPAQKGLDY